MPVIPGRREAADPEPMTTIRAVFIDPGLPRFARAPG
jgi:hypothetical protein